MQPMHLSRVLVDRKIAHLQLGLSMPFICDPQVTLRLACGSPKWVPYACDFRLLDCCDIAVLMCAVHVFGALLPVQPSRPHQRCCRVLCVLIFAERVATFAL